MSVLVLNCGSSSIKADILEPSTGRRFVSLDVERINSGTPQLRIDEGPLQPCQGSDHQSVLSHALPALLAACPEAHQPRAVGHRVVHGGEAFTAPTLLTAEIETQLEAIADLAPLHHPANLAGIRVARALLPNLPHVAVFDTAFHKTLPERAKYYAIPSELSEKYQIRRYGFHGISHAYVSQAAAHFLGKDRRDLKLLTCHLGNGCSITAIEHGRSVETSMGMTPLEGLVMGTRSGDLDVGVVLELMRKEGLDVDQIDQLLNKRSGLTGLSGVGNDMRDIEERAAQGDEACRLTLQVFAHRVRKYIGAYAAVMGGVDAIVFTAGIGQHSATIRHRITQRLDFLGVTLDETRNREAKVDFDNPVCRISSSASKATLLVIATDEEREIARSTEALVSGAEAPSAPQKATGPSEEQAPTERVIPVAISARHVHLDQATVDKLFGEGHQLRERKPLSQPGQFAAEETVTIVGPKRSIEGVRVLGPVRSKNQVEVSRTDEFTLGIDAPVRASGKVEDSPGCTLVGPKGEVKLTQGVICAWRHIHMTPDDAAYFGVKDRDVVEVAVDSEGRDLVFGDVLIRVSPKYKLEMHIDTDEGNAADLPRKSEGVLYETQAKALFRK